MMMMMKEDIHKHVPPLPWGGGWLRPHSLGGIAVIGLLPVCLCVCFSVWLCVCTGVSVSVGRCHSQCLCAYYHLCVCFSFGSHATVPRRQCQYSPVELFVFLCLRTGKRKPILSASAALEAVHRMGGWGLGLGLTDRSNRAGSFLQHPAAAARQFRGAAAN